MYAIGRNFMTKRYFLPCRSQLTLYSTKRRVLLVHPLHTHTTSSTTLPHHRHNLSPPQASSSLSSPHTINWTTAATAFLPIYRHILVIIAVICCIVAGVPPFSTMLLPPPPLLPSRPTTPSKAHTRQRNPPRPLCGVGQDQNHQGLCCWAINNHNSVLPSS